MKIITQEIKPPVPSDQYDWIAVFDSYEEGDHAGYGPTEDAAIVDLLNKVFQGELQ